MSVAESYQWPAPSRCGGVGNSGEQVVAEAAGTGGTIVHTLVDADRRRELDRLGLPANVAHPDLDAVTAGVEAARRFCRQHDFAVVTVTDRTVEAGAGEVTELVGELSRSP